MSGGRQACPAVNSLYMREHSSEEEPLPEPTMKTMWSGRPRGCPRTRVQSASTLLVDEDDQAAAVHTGVDGTSPESLNHGEAAIAIVRGSTSTPSGSTSSGVYL